MDGDATILVGATVRQAPITYYPDGPPVVGHVIAADGEPLAEAIVAAAGWPQQSADGAGRFQLDEAGMGLFVWAVAWHPTRPECIAQRLDLRHRDEVELVVRPLVSAAGRILGPNGGPVAGARVQLRTHFAVEHPGPSGRAGSVWSEWSWLDDLCEHLGLESRLIDGLGSVDIQAVTDGAGRFRAEKLIPGAEYSGSIDDAQGQLGVTNSYTHFVADPDRDVTDLGDIRVREFRSPGP
jgi:hypothetical protein